MKTKDLIGKKIADVKDKIGTFDSSNEIQTSDGIIILESGEIFEIPYRGSKNLSMLKNDSFGYTSILNEDSFFKKLFTNLKYEKNISNRNKRAIKGKTIVGIYQFEEAKDEDEWNELEERMIIELESGYLISEVGMSPFGTDAASLYVFTSKEELETEYNQKLEKIY